MTQLTLLTNVKMLIPSRLHHSRNMTLLFKSLATKGFELDAVITLSFVPFLQLLLAGNTLLLGPAQLNSPASSKILLDSAAS
jgi:hypothetical protein